MVESAESTESKEGVEGFRDGSGEAAGVTYESIPVGKTVLNSLCY